MRTDGIYLFPFDIEDSKKPQFSNINYGDIGIGYTLYHAGKLLENNEYSNRGIETISNFAKLRDDDAESIRDATLLYGSSGIYSVLNQFKGYTSNQILREATDYWLKRTGDFGNNKKAWAGYNTFYNGERNHLQLSFDQGIIGIGITLICSQLDLQPKYLKFMNYNFL